MAYSLESITVLKNWSCLKKVLEQMKTVVLQIKPKEINILSVYVDCDSGGVVHQLCTASLSIKSYPSGSFLLLLV